MGKLLTPQKAREMSGGEWKPWITLTSWGGSLVFGLQRSLNMVLEGDEHIPNESCIVATNHTHNYDFLPLRYLFYHQKGKSLATWIKARAWQGRLLIHYLSNTANVPLASRGYIISGDVKSLFHRKPSEEEYRALRDHLDQGVDLPEGEFFDRVQNEQRLIFDQPFNPSEQTYREALEACFIDFMDASLEVAQRVTDNGIFHHVNPQGSRSSRLTTGKPGVIHIAASLKIPILPVSIIGMRSAMPNQGLKSAGGTVTVRCGAPYLPELSDLSEEYLPFRAMNQADEAVVQRELTHLMSKINDLCDEETCMSEGFVSDGKQGVARFL